MLKRTGFVVLMKCQKRCRVFFVPKDGRLKAGLAGQHCIRGKGGPTNHDGDADLRAVCNIERSTVVAFILYFEGLCVEWTHFHQHTIVRRIGRRHFA